MKKFQGKDWHKYAWKPRLTISDGWRTRLVHLEDLMEICHYSESHARKIIAGQKPLTPAAEDLLRMAILRAHPGWEPGWYIEQDGTISTPNGFTFDTSQLEQFAFMCSLHRSMRRDAEKVHKEDKELKEEIETLKQRLKERTELRVYVNDNAEPARTLKLIKR